MPIEANMYAIYNIYIFADSYMPHTDIQQIVLFVCLHTCMYACIHKHIIYKKSQ